MSIVDDIKSAMARHRETRTVIPKGQALYDLNRWKGEETRKLKAEYNRRLAEIEDRPDSVREQVNQEVLDLVALAATQGVSRSNIRVALGRQTLDETDEIIALARETLHEKVETGEALPFALRKTGQIHGKGWPMYRVTLHETGETFESVYLVTLALHTEPRREQLRISPSPAGSVEILDRLHYAGVTAAIFAAGKE